MGDEYPNDWKARLFTKLDEIGEAHNAVLIEVALLKQKQNIMWGIFGFIGLTIGGIIIERLMHV